MLLTLDTLDGVYQVRSHAPGDARRTADDSVIPNGDGETTISNGMSFRKDRNGFIWESNFSIVGDARVEMVSTVDPSHAAEDAFVIDEKGNPTKGMVTYRAILDAFEEDGRLVLRGEIRHGGGGAAVTLTKLS